jgi:DNA-binding XRE family transcriptional regulator
MDSGSVLSRLPPLAKSTAPADGLLVLTSVMHLFIDINPFLSIFIVIMGRKAITLLPTTQRMLEQTGEQIKLSRLRRQLSVDLVAQRAGVSRASVWAVEKGSPSVAMGIYANVLLAIGREKDLLLIARDDELGRKLQDLALPTRKRAPKEP